MSRSPTIAAVLIRSLRAHGHRPAGTDAAPTWSQLVDTSRRLSLGLIDAGWSGHRIGVSPSNDPLLDLARELAVLGAGAVLAMWEEGAEARLVGGALHPAGGPLVDAGDLLARGDRLDGRAPAEAEAQVARLLPDAPACVDRRRVVTQAEVAWALRSVERWLAPAVGPSGPGVVVSAPGPAAPALPSALVGRWWPATAGARLAPNPDSAVAVRGVHPDVALLSSATWAELAEMVRERAAGSLGGATLLDRGRLVVSGESSSWRERGALALARRWSGERIREGGGLGVLRLGLCFEPVDRSAAQDLASVGVALAPAWVTDGVPAPLAAAPVVRTAPLDGWGRPLPGRRMVSAGAHTTVHGGDVGPEGCVVDGALRVDRRSRVALPHRTPVRASRAPQ